MVSRVVSVCVVIAALLAAYICFNLTTKHLYGTTGVAWFEALCAPASQEGQAGCAKVLESPYSYLPPKFPDRPDGLPHFPVSFLGFLYYSAILVWVLGVGQVSYARRRIHLIPLLFLGFGLAFSGYYLFLMYRVIDQSCPMCLVTHALNALIAIGLVILWPWKKPQSDFGDEPTAPAAVSIETAEHPVPRLVWTTLLAIVLVTYGHFFMFAWREQRAQLDLARKEVAFYRSNVGGFVAQWQLAPHCDIPLRPDESVRAFSGSQADQPALEVVVFSDFECPACAKFAEFFERSVPPLFDHRVRLVFKHYPLDLSCNPRTTQTMHPHACPASYLAEGARTLKGDEAFWKAHDYLFANRGAIAAGTLHAGRLASQLGVDAASLESASELGAHQERILQDIDQGRACNIRGTPSVFVEGKRIESAAATNLEFWNKIADWFWLEKAKSDRPATSQMPPPGPQG